MTFEELGQALKEEREKQGLSIQMVMESTKISRTNIVAMENGDRSTLPYPVYTRGFVKSYARYLGLDADEFVMIVDQVYSDESDGPEEHIYEVSPAAEKAFQNSEPVEGKKKSILPLLLVLVLLAGIGVLVFLNMGGSKLELPGQNSAITTPSEQDAAQPDAAVEEAAPLAEEEAAPAEDAEVVPMEEPADDAAVQDGTESDEQAEQHDQAAVDAVETGNNAQPDSSVENEQTANMVTDTDGEAEKQKYDHVLVIRATTNKGCWIGLWRGDSPKMARDFVLKKGEPLRLMFNSPRRIRIGNVAGVTVTYNGKDYPLNDAVGNIQTLTFGMDE